MKECTFVRLPTPCSLFPWQSPWWFTVSLHLASFHDSIPHSTLSASVVPPTIVTSPVSLQPVEGSRVALDCVANGDPPPTISWQRNNTPLTPPGRCACHHRTITCHSSSPSLTLLSPFPHPPLTLLQLFHPLPQWVVGSEPGQPVTGGRVHVHCQQPRGCGHAVT